MSETLGIRRLRSVLLTIGNANREGITCSATPYVRATTRNGDALLWRCFRTLC